MDQTPLIARIREIAAARVRYGYQRIHVLLRREGWQINRKRVYRLYRIEGLSLYQRRPRRSRVAQQRCPACNKGVHFSRVSVPEGVDLDSFDARDEVVVARVPNFEPVAASE